jgi:hypothetical protein
VNREEMIFNCPKSLVVAVTENGSGSDQNLPN